MAKDIEGINVPVHILGGPAYPLRTWLMKPYTQPGATSREQAFNTTLSSTSTVIQRAFSHLKGRWRILLKKKDTQIKNINNVILSCAVIHNLCESEDSYDETWDVADDIVEADGVIDDEEEEEDNSIARGIRDVLCNQSIDI